MSESSALFQSTPSVERPAALRASRSVANNSSRTSYSGPSSFSNRRFSHLDRAGLWPAVETAVREFSKLRIDRANARMAAPQGDSSQQKPDDPVGRLRERADNMASSAAAMKKIADAADPLYKTLDDGQKRRLAVLTGMDRFRGRGEGWRERRMERFERDRDDGGRERGYDRNRYDRDRTPDQGGPERL